MDRRIIKERLISFARLSLLSALCSGCATQHIDAQEGQSRPDLYVFEEPESTVFEEPVSSEITSEEGPLSPPCSAPRSMWVRRCSAALMRQGQRYLSDPTFRRQVLEASLVTPSNGYSQLRLLNNTERAWGSLPLRWPRFR